MKSMLHPKFFGLFVLFLITTVNASLHEEVQAEIRNQDPNAHVGIMVYSLSDKKVLYEHQADKLFVPASVSKVVTAASALHHLGDNYRFTTQLLHDGIVTGNTLKGNLYLKGDGDPSLTSKDLATLRSR
jgi:serine-type D-Ala-D-Ala carboxypeptidase/endopeptidase (penicillin-binding protein 4)